MQQIRVRKLNSVQGEAGENHTIIFDGASLETLNETDRLLEVFAKEQKLNYVDISPGLLAADGVYLPGMTLDFCHPTDKGYQVWANAIRPYVDEP